MGFQESLGREFVTCSNFFIWSAVACYLVLGPLRNRKGSRIASLIEKKNSIAVCTKTRLRLAPLNGGKNLGRIV
jgi:hypothetical protein